MLLFQLPALRETRSRSVDIKLPEISFPWTLGGSASSIHPRDLWGTELRIPSWVGAPQMENCPHLPVIGLPSSKCVLVSPSSVLCILPGWWVYWLDWNLWNGMETEYWLVEWNGDRVLTGGMGPCGMEWRQYWMLEWEWRQSFEWWNGAMWNEMGPGGLELSVI